MNAVAVIALLTLKEAVRRRLVIAVSILTLVVMAGSGFAVWKITGITGPRGEPIPPTVLYGIVSQFEIFLLFMFASLLAITAAFIGAPSVAGDIESGVFLSMLTRPIRRADLLLGKWLGLAGVTVAFCAGAVILDFTMIWIISGYVPPHPVLAGVFTAWEALVLLSLAVLFSTRLPGTASGILVIGAYFLAWMGGIAGGIGAALKSDTISDIGRVTRVLVPTDGLWHGAMYSMEPVSLIAAAGSNPAAASNPFIAVAPPAGAYVAWCAAWIGLVLALCVLSFRRRAI